MFQKRGCEPGQLGGIVVRSIIYYSLDITGQSPLIIDKPLDACQH